MCLLMSLLLLETLMPSLDPSLAAVAPPPFLSPGLGAVVMTLRRIALPVGEVGICSELVVPVVAHFLRAAAFDWNNDIGIPDVSQFEPAN